MFRFGASVCWYSEDEGEVAQNEYHVNESLTFHILVCIWRIMKCLLLYTDIHRAIHLFTIWTN
jgi:hypothetical protein